MKKATERSLAEYLPFWRTVSAEGGAALVTPTLDYVGGFELGALDARLASESAIAGCGESLRSFLSSADEACTLHFLYRVSDDVEGHIREYERAHESRGEGEDIPALRAYVEGRARWLRSQALRTSRVYLFFSAEPAVRWRAPLGAKMLFASLSRFAEEQHRAQLQALGSLRNVLRARLSQVGIPTRDLAAEEFHGLYHELLNPTHAAKRWPCPAVRVRDNLWDESVIQREGDELREYTEAEQLVLEDLVEERGYFRQEHTFRRALTLKTLPEGGTGYLTSEALASLSTQADGRARPFPYWLSVTVSIQRQAVAKWLLSAQHGLVRALRGAIPFLANNSVQKDAADAAQQRGIVELFAELNAMSSKLARLSVTVLLDGDSLVQLAERTEAARSAFASIGNSELLLEEVTQLPAFLSMLPGSGPYQLRAKQCTSRNAADFIPVFAPWRGTARPSSLLFTPDWDIFKLDVLDASLAATHGIIPADTGSGKSVSLGALTLDAVAGGANAILIDNGGSWEPMTRLLGGIHLPVDIKTPITPFRPWSEMLTAAGELDVEAVQDVVTYLELCTREEGENGFDKLTLQLVARAVRQAYESRFRKVPEERPLMSAFRSAIHDVGALAAHSDDRAICERIHRRLGLFVGDELYGTFLDRPSTLRFDARVMTFDMAGVSRSPVTRSIAMATVMQAITARAARGNGRRTLVEVDEGHVYLGQDVVAERFLERCYRVMRKYGVGMWMISQQFGDFLKSRAGEVMVANSPIKIFLRHSSGHAAIADYFQLSARARAAFQSLQMVRGHYSDFFLMFGERQTAVRLALHPLAYWILTTDARDKQLIERAAQKNPGMDRLSLLQHLAREYPHGASGPRLLKEKAA